ncbi:MAG: aspartate kinase [Clostridiales bacterium]|nr:aspartate kinase [Clostridiales bacterium]
MALLVQKFGGSSLANAGRLRRVAQRVSETVALGHSVAVVVSAMGDTTDDLIALAHQLTGRTFSREMDMLMATGEQQSIALLAMTLLDMGIPAISLTGRMAGFRTDGNFGNGRIMHMECGRVEQELAKGKVVVVAGFQGIDEEENVITLGRGGSDTSAVALAVAIGADICEIFTDVDGVFTADPRIVKKAWKMPYISYDEMLEMAAMGALVLQPRSVELAKQYGVKLHVRSSFNYSEGTIVRKEALMNRDLEKELVVCGVAHDLNVLKVTLFAVPDSPGVAGRIFGVLAAEGANVDMIIQGGNRADKQDLSFTCGRDERDRIEGALKELVKDLAAEGYELCDTKAKISIVGAGMITNPGVAARMFKVLADIDCNIDMISTSEIKISCIVDETKTKQAVLALHTAFDLDAQDK